MLLIIPLAAASSFQVPTCSPTSAIAAVHVGGRYVAVVEDHSVRVLDLVTGGDATGPTELVRAKLLDVRARPASDPRCFHPPDRLDNSCLVRELNKAVLESHPTLAFFEEVASTADVGASGRFAPLSEERSTAQFTSRAHTYYAKRGTVLELSFTGDGACLATGPEQTIRYYGPDGNRAGDHAEIDSIYFGVEHIVVIGHDWQSCALRIAAVGNCGLFAN